MFIVLLLCVLMLNLITKTNGVQCASELSCLFIFESKEFYGVVVDGVNEAKINDA